MKLSLSNALKQVLNESVDFDAVRQAIDNNVMVEITYDDTQENPPLGKRWIEPCSIVDMSRPKYPHKWAGKEGGLAIRAYVINNSASRRGELPDWRLFKLNRIISWRPTKTKFLYEPDDRFNPNGDKQYEVVHQIQFGQVGQMLKRNLAISQSEKEKQGFDVFGKKLKKQKDLSTPKMNSKGPKTNDDIKKVQMNQMWIDKDNQTQAQKQAELDKMWNDRGNTSQTDYSTFNKDMRKGWDALYHRQKRANDKQKREQDKIKNINDIPQNDAYTDSAEYQKYKEKNGFLEETLNKIMKEIGYI